MRKFTDGRNLGSEVRLYTEMLRNGKNNAGKKITARASSGRRITQGIKKRKKRREIEEEKKERNGV